jgi:hypothetical protein
MKTPIFNTEEPDMPVLYLVYFSHNKTYVSAGIFLIFIKPAQNNYLRTCAREIFLYDNN